MERGILEDDVIDPRSEKVTKLSNFALSEGSAKAPVFSQWILGKVTKWLRLS
jgi:hypothetical protein